MRYFDTVMQSEIIMMRNCIHPLKHLPFVFKTFRQITEVKFYVDWCLKNINAKF